jgi:putative FmdB family regulatory protein
MPVYEYRCEECGEEFEVRQRMNDAELTEHECGGKLVRVFNTPPALEFKGTGWTEKAYK